MNPNRALMQAPGPPDIRYNQPQQPNSYLAPPIPYQPIYSPYPAFLPPPVAYQGPFETGYPLPPQPVPPHAPQADANHNYVGQGQPQTGPIQPPNFDQSRQSLQNFQHQPQMSQLNPINSQPQRDPKQSHQHQQHKHWGGNTNGHSSFRDSRGFPSHQDNFTSQGRFYNGYPRHQNSHSNLHQSSHPYYPIYQPPPLTISLPPPIPQQSQQQLQNQQLQNPQLLPNNQPNSQSNIQSGTQNSNTGQISSQNNDRPKPSKSSKRHKKQSSRDAKKFQDISSFDRLPMAQTIERQREKWGWVIPEAPHREVRPKQELPPGALGEAEAAFAELFRRFE
ncbi:hypothetical protein TRFO_22372 [Tritrichomonas foetus]|uniref:Uncharacterized protein n=1 Tax=Tritrichomonas foetus TaxID=1144522 RepID=A0A1J4KC04_9EUKA|nr:hypothetical protein TRFO_22372 [Tritrichomonas foetus]|eukprot:OHT08945.1 hypothetical protein TRFO_22372 [Tritrichomonas foetus]